ncbi:HK97 family phage prohead protease [Rhodococcus pyridinivorans]|uniref:Putative prohead protease n=1 Tax=Rhodococcus pyridinivorans AK37 TaxID=1114960 RepID=H0JL56_9NOCA|nr:HK97 family phage prohead protease [Rhodococcus pyridinivorans]EHK86391.1 putative prohead protease [Rhodococcus pyridinivorans AK37]MCD2139518.1 HK97 family phage prohead protease [Rhodococcus pyridinivorans]
MNTKSCPIKVKAGADAGLEEGEFYAYASVFGNKDSYGDVVQPGAFANTLDAWSKKDAVIPLLWGHKTDDPDYNIGEILSAEEDERGLKVHARLDLEEPKAKQTYKLLKAGRVSQMSFAYAIVDGEYVQPTGEGKTWRDAYYSLKELDLFEVSVVPIGANQETEILAVKAAAESLRAKAGRALSAKNEATLRDAKKQLEEAASSIDDVLAVLGDEVDDEDGDNEDQDQTSGEESTPGSSDENSAGKSAPTPSVYLASKAALLERELEVIA